METRREKKEEGPALFSPLRPACVSGLRAPLWLWLPPENILVGCGRIELNFGCFGGSHLSPGFGQYGYKEAYTGYWGMSCSTLGFLAALAFVVASQACLSERPARDSSLHPGSGWEKRRGEGGMSVCNASASM